MNHFTPFKQMVTLRLKGKIWELLRMKYLLSLLSVILLIGCQNDNETDTQENQNIEEDTDNETDQTAENDNEALDEEQDTDSNESTNNVSEEDTNSEENQTPDTQFDIDSETVQQELFNFEQTEDSLTFSQDVITESMTQTEVENLYGEYDLIYPGHGIPIIIYGNLGVRYSESFTDEAQEENINPDENTVEDVFYYADTPYDEVVSALGEPDTDVYETTEGPVGGIYIR